MGTSSRSARKEKRKKTNRILNTAIAVVVLLIVIVGFTIFAGANEEPAAPETPASTEPAASNSKKQETNTQEQAAAPAAKEPEKAEEPEKTEEPAETKTAEKPVEEPVVKEGTEPNVKQEIVDPNWQGVGTTQSGSHESSFQTDSTDWQEKEQALAYATGIPREEMTVWFISGNGPSGAIGTVSPKSNQDEAYRVYIKWVDGEGWKPVKVQKLIENDKGR